MGVSNSQPSRTASLSALEESQHQDSHSQNIPGRDQGITMSNLGRRCYWNGTALCQWHRACWQQDSSSNTAAQWEVRDYSTMHGSFYTRWKDLHHRNLPSNVSCREQSPVAPSDTLLAVVPNCFLPPRLQNLPRVTNSSSVSTLKLNATPSNEWKAMERKVVPGVCTKLCVCATPSSYSSVFPRHPVLG